MVDLNEKKENQKNEHHSGLTMSPEEEIKMCKSCRADGNKWQFHCRTTKELG